MDLKRIVIESNNEEETDYFVSYDGRIFKEITPSKNGNGYAMVTIYKNGIGYTKSVHRIVAKAFLQMFLLILHTINFLYCPFW